MNNNLLSKEELVKVNGGCNPAYEHILAGAGVDRANFVAEKSPAVSPYCVPGLAF